MRTIAVVNRKGGVGKTTTAANVAHALAADGYRVLALDLDPQGHLASALGADGGGPGIDGCLLRDAPLAQAVRPARDNLWLVPAGAELAEVEGLAGGPERGTRLARALTGLGEDFDLAVVDAPPSARLLAANALLAATDAVLPVPCEYLALDGLAGLLATLERLERVHGRVTRRWLAVTRYQGRRRLSREVRELLVARFPDQVLATAVRENAAVAEAPGFGRTVLEYAPRSHGAQDYTRLAADLMTGRTL
ncbi:ParA family protein [Spiribacter halobius]|uniref:ParA family protein n=1 Tax=Sediminicurvatus halobius TaxID=2182432 RepID=A0A2U2N4V3_9GAMM|nr:ParA family protein [Spiribacter halobius]PWG64132.1 ParA family protein [Spiribacter halobius]UEX78745.1 ParA family protein [Spiribacter halobius]